MFTTPTLYTPNLVYGMGGTGPNVTFFDPANPADKAKLANDGVFLAVVGRALQSNHASPENYEKVMRALANGDLSALTLDERAAIVAGASQLRDGYRCTVDQAADRLVALIDRSTNNQANTGPGSDQIVTTTPKAGGGQLAVTAGELQDNEGFSALAFKVFSEAGGSVDQWNNPFSTATYGSNGHSLFGDISWGGVDMSKWSTEERASFLQLVAEVGGHGRLSGQDEMRLAQAVQQRNNGGGDEASITLPVSGKKVSADDLMENGTFKKLIFESLGWGFPGRGTSAAVNDLADLIATADYGQLSLSERSALLTAIDRALDPRNGGFTGDKAANILEMLKGFLAVDSSSCSAPPDHTLSNGLAISNASLASPDQFGSLVQQTLQRSGISVGGRTQGWNPGFLQTHQASMLMTLDVSGLSPDQRLRVLEKIATASRDEVIDSTEMRDIMNAAGRTFGLSF